MIFKVLGIALVTVIVSVILKQNAPELAPIASIAGGMMVVLSVIEPARELIDTLLQTTMLSSVSQSIISPILKVMGLGYLTEFTANLAEDAGIKYLSSKIYLAGKICILVVCLPLAISAINIVLGLL